MKVVLMGAFPVYDYAEELGIDPKSFQRVTSWNENLVNGLAGLPEVEVCFITSTKLIPKTRTIRRRNFSVIFFVAPTKANLLTGLQYTRWAIHRMLRKIKPDVVHGIGTEHIWPYIAVTSSFPSVVTVHGVMSEIVQSVPTPRISRQRVFAALERQVLRRTEHLISINPYVRSALGKYTCAQTYIVENAVSECFFRCRARPGVSQRILFVGDIQPGKDVLSLVDAFAMSVERVSSADHIMLSVVGPISDHEYHRKLRDLIRHRGVEHRIVFRGFMLPEELAREYEQAALLVLPSLQETAPMCIAEAMCCGLPVVATRVGGVEYMVQDGETGFLVEPRDPEALAEAMGQLMSSPILRERMGTRAREIARKRFHPDIIAEKTLNVYETVLRENRL